MNIDNIYSIAKYLDIGTLGRISKIIPLPEKLNRKLKYYKTGLIICIKCNQEMSFCENVDSEDHDIFCISDHRNGEKYYYCKNCEYFYQLCPKCSDSDEKILCQFIGFHGWFIGYVKYRFVDTILINEFLKELPDFQKYLENGILGFSITDKYIVYIYQLDKKIIEILNNNEKKIKKPFCQYSTLDLDLEYFYVGKCYPTGPFCYFFHFWKCKNCGTIYQNGYEN